MPDDTLVRQHLEGPFKVSYTAVPLAGLSYFTVLDADFEPVGLVDKFLRSIRHGRGLSEGTTKTYANQLSMFVTWCAAKNYTIEQGVSDYDDFLAHLRSTPVQRKGRGYGKPREKSTIKGIHNAVAQMIGWADKAGLVDAGVKKKLYLADDARLRELASRSGSKRTLVHSIGRAPEPALEHATQEEYIALLKACKSERDTFLGVLLYEVGLRIGAAMGLRIGDMHFSSKPIKGCSYRDGHHLHVRTRENPNKASTKKPEGSDFALPVTPIVVERYHVMRHERDAIAQCKKSSFVFTNQAKGVIGAPMRADNAAKMFAAASRRAGLSRKINPHMLRHSFGMKMAEAGEDRVIAMGLMMHKHIDTTMRYFKASDLQLRAAVERVGSPLDDVASGFSDAAS